MQEKVGQSKTQTTDIVVCPVGSSFHTTLIEGIPVITPRSPYETQKLFMTEVVKSLKDGSNALLESPTGTGKTMSLLCSTLSWLAFEQKVNRLAQTKIIYTSRTHAQLKQVIKELKTTGFDTKMSVVASRDHGCINFELEQLAGKGKELQCRLRVAGENGKTCPYFMHQKTYQKMTHLGKIMDLEESNFRGKCERYCPFYYGKAAMGKANIVFMPYNYLFQEGLLSLDDRSLLRHSIIIIDEAHNIQRVCEESLEMNISSRELSQAVEQLANLAGPSKKGIKSQENVNVNTEGHMDVLINMAAYLQGCDVPATQDGLLLPKKLLKQRLAEILGIKGNSRTQLNKIVQHSPILQSLMSVKPYFALQKFIDMLYLCHRILSNKGNCVFIGQLNRDGSQTKLSLHCLDPAEGFSVLKKLDPISIILASGTLSPMSSWAGELGMPFKQLLSCPHVLKPEQLKCHVVKNGPTNSLNLQYNNRLNPELFSDVGKVLLSIIKATPNGIVVFFPSYALLDSVKAALDRTKTLQKIYECKSVFFERKSAVQFKSTIEAYMKEARRERGAVLFALTRGKISEGLDFADDLCRAVVLVGVPFPPSKDVRITSKMAYLNQCPAKGINGKQWYMTETARIINQCLGRLVRHREDYGVAYLIDERFANKEILSRLPDWVQPHLKISQNFQKLEVEIEQNGQQIRLKSQQPNLLISHRGTVLSTYTPNSSSSKQLPPLLAPPKKTLKQLMAEIKAKEPPPPIPERTPEQLRADALQRQIFMRPKPSEKKDLIVEKLQDCPVCLRPKKLISNAACIHRFCDQCWKNWLKMNLSCPFCRERVRQKFLLPEQSAAKNSEQNDKND